EEAPGTVGCYDEDAAKVARGVRWVSTQSGGWAASPGGLRFGKDWAQDRGRDRSLFSPSVQYGEGAGLIVGGGPTFTDFGFRRAPFRSRLGFNVLYGTKSGGWGAELSAEHRMENSRLASTLDARATEFEAFRFYGFGNDTPDLGDEESLVMMDQVTVYPALTWVIGPRPGNLPPGSEPDGEGEGEEDEGGEVERAFLLGKREGIRGSFSIGPLAHWTSTRVPTGNPLDGRSEERRGGREC